MAESLTLGDLTSTLTTVLDKSNEKTEENIVEQTSVLSDMFTHLKGIKNAIITSFMYQKKKDFDNQSANTSDSKAIQAYSSKDIEDTEKEKKDKFSFGKLFSDGKKQYDILGGKFTKVIDSFKMVGKVIGKALIWINAIWSVFDGFMTMFDTDKVKDISGGDSFWDRITVGISQAISTFTMGLLDTKTIYNALASIGTIFKDMFDYVVNLLSGRLKNISSIISSIIDDVVEGIKTTFNDMFSSIKNFFSTGIFDKNLWFSAYDEVMQMVDSVIGGIVGFAEKVSGLFSGIKDKITNIIDTVFDGIQSIKDSILVWIHGKTFGAFGKSQEEVDKEREQRDKAKQEKQKTPSIKVSKVLSYDDWVEQENNGKQNKRWYKKYVKMQKKKQRLGINQEVVKESQQTDGEKQKTPSVKTSKILSYDDWVEQENNGKQNKRWYKKYVKMQKKKQKFDERLVRAKPISKENKISSYDKIKGETSGNNDVKMTDKNIKNKKKVADENKAKVMLETSKQTESKKIAQATNNIVTDNTSNNTNNNITYAINSSKNYNPVY